MPRRKKHDQPAWRFEFRRHDPTGDVYACTLGEDGAVELMAGPIAKTDQTKPKLTTFGYGKPLQRFVEAPEEFVTIDPDVEHLAREEAAAAADRASDDPTALTDRVFIGEVVALEEAVRAAAEEYEDAKEEASRLRKEWEAQVEALLAFIRRRHDPGEPKPLLEIAEKLKKAWDDTPDDEALVERP